MGVGRSCNANTVLYLGIIISVQAKRRRTGGGGGGREANGGMGMVVGIDDEMGVLDNMGRGS